MSGKGDILAGQAAVRLFLKDDMKTQLKTAMGNFRAGLSSMASALAGPAAVGSAAIAALGVAVNNYVAQGSEINDMSARTGASAAQLQHWSFAAKQSGASAEDLEKALRSAAKNGVGPGQFERVGKEIAGIKDPAERSSAAMEMFGKSGTKLIPMFNDLNALKASSNALGPVLSEEQVKAADALGDAFGAMTESLKRMANTFAATLGPHLLGPIQTAIGMITAFQDAIAGTGTDFSGDLLDRLAQFRRTSSADFQKRGAMAASGFLAGKGGAGGAGDEGEGGAEGKTNGALQSQDAIIKSILAGQRARFALANQFATAEERHAQKMNEFNQALIQLNRNRVTNFISPQEFAAEHQMLTVAMQRADAAERERRAREFARLHPGMDAKAPDKNKLPDKPEVSYSTSATTSAAGALAMSGGGTQGLSKKIVDELKALRRESIAQHREALRAMGPKAA